MTKKLFNKVLIIGVGLIGSSIARALKYYEISDQIVGCDISANVKDKCKKLKAVVKYKNGKYCTWYCAKKK